MREPTGAWFGLLCFTCFVTFVLLPRYHKTQVAFLRTEVARAEERLKLIDSVYNAEASYEQSVQAQGAAMARLQGQIAKVKKVIDDAECPPDDSMFNLVVVVVSGAFVSASKGGGKATGASDINTLCTDLEGMGYYVRQCDSIKEATARIKELHISKKLRCVIFDVYDYTKNQQNANRNAYGSAGPAASKSDITFANIANCLSDMTSEDSTFAIKYSPIETCRFASMDTMSTLVYDQREYFWQTNVTVHEKPAKCLTWIDEDADFTHFEPEETTALSATEMQAKRLELDNLQQKKSDLTQECEEASEGHQSHMLGIFKSLAELLDDEIAAIDAAITKTDGFAAFLGQLPKPAAATGAPAPVLQVSVRLRGPAVSINLDGVNSWGALMESVSQASGAFIDTDSVITLIADAKDTLADVGTDSVSSWDAYVAAGGGDFAVVQPRYSAELVLHMLNAPAELWLPRHRGRSEVHFNAQAAQMKSVLKEHRDYLEKISLAAAVMAKVPVQQKKLLNLAHDWLHTFLPHCMKKVNRVSFGLLNDLECRNALAVDPLLPPSRLKLGVPFVGKDVPSQSSEFAHPDIILGLTIFAYRYQGLRRADFNDLMDLITASFTHEIGPPNDRPSSIMYRQWVLDAGGAIRGDVPTDEAEGADGGDGDKKSDADDDSKEVVDLKYLQRNNTEQMQKLYNLWKEHPAVLYVVGATTPRALCFSACACR